MSDQQRGQFEHITGHDNRRTVVTISVERARDLLKAHGMARNVDRSLDSLKGNPGAELNVDGGTIRYVRALQ